MSGQTDKRFIHELEALSRLVPTASNPAGRDAVRTKLVAWFESLGFGVREVGADAGSRVVVAVRQGQGLSLGLCGHYDVEEAGPGWETPPFVPTRVGDRVVGRGVADNLGPLVMRLMALERLGAPTAHLCFILQGEEETGSPLAHELFPSLDLPRVDLWVEETGYFETDGTQRLLTRDLDEPAEVLVAAVERDAIATGRGVVRHSRYLNKAFGETRCPFLTHLVRGSPYVALGPNDPHSHIHRSGESLPLGNLPLAMRQFQTLVTVAAEVR